MTCGRTLDIIFILDSSSDVGDVHFNSLKIGLSDILEQYQIGFDSIRVGVMCSSTDPMFIIELGSHGDVSSLQTSIANIPYVPADSNMPGAIDITVQKLNTNGRNGIPKLIIVLTATNTNNVASLSASAMNAANQGFDIFAVGIAGVVTDLELNTIASDVSHVYRVSNFMLPSFDDITNGLITRTCSG